MKRQKLAERLGSFERALRTAPPWQRVGLEVGIEALRKAIGELSHRISELGGR